MLALAAASLAPVSNLSAAPGPQPAPTTVGAELDGRAYAFLLSDHEREREERANRTDRDHRPTAKPQPTKSKPKTVKKRAHVKPPQKKATKKATKKRVRARSHTRPSAPTRVHGSRARVIINFALAQVGKPYVFGADGPGSYDCSGLVKAAFARVGIHLPHQTGQLVHRGRRVSRAALQPGDLVFPDSGHVGIYLGRGKMVHASNPRTDIKVSTVYAFWTARRLL